MASSLVKSPSLLAGSGQTSRTLRPFRAAPQIRRLNDGAVRPTIVTAAGSGASSSSASGWAIDGNRPTSPKAWEIMSTALRKSGVKMVSPQEVNFALQRGSPVVDIRPGGDYSAGRLPGAVNIQFLRLIEGWGPIKVLRRAVYAFFGVLNGTEYNDRFFDEFTAMVPDKNANIIVYCNIGGSLEPTGPSKFGQQSRSLSAAYELVRAGYKRVKVMDGGFQQWVKSEREIEYEQ